MRNTLHEKTGGARQDRTARQDLDPEEGGGMSQAGMLGGASFDLEAAAVNGASGRSDVNPACGVDVMEAPRSDRPHVSGVFGGDSTGDWTQRGWCELLLLFGVLLFCNALFVRGNNGTTDRGFALILILIGLFYTCRNCHKNWKRWNRDDTVGTRQQIGTEFAGGTEVASGSQLCGKNIIPSLLR